MAKTDAQRQDERDAYLRALLGNHYDEGYYRKTGAEIRSRLAEPLRSLRPYRRERPDTEGRGE